MIPRSPTSLPFAVVAAVTIAAGACCGAVHAAASATQTLRIETPGCESARCEVSNDKGHWTVESTPGTVTVATSIKPLDVSCIMQGAGSPLGPTRVPSAKGESNTSATIAGGIAGAALGIAAISSFIAGTVGVVGLMLLAPPLAKFGLSFSSPEYFALMAMGLAMVVLLAGASMIKALLALLVGLWIASIGIDLFSDASRFTFGQSELLDGVDFVIVAIGVFALGEVFGNMEKRGEGTMLPVPKGLRNLLPTMAELKACRFAFLNGSVIGFIIGVLPGAGSTVASFISYGIEKAVSRHPEKFGTGVPEGVAAPEGANNSETGGAMVPLLTLGIPGSGTTAILLAAFILWGLRPGPLMIQDNPELFWGLVASMYVGNIMLLVLNLPLIPLFAQILKLREYFLYPIIFGISIVGVYSVSGSLFDCWLLAVFGLLGYVMRRLDYPSAPLILGLVLGDSMERALRQSLMMSQGDLGILVSRPISATMLILTVLLLFLPLFRKANAWRIKAIEENG